MYGLPADAYIVKIFDKKYAFDIIDLIMITTDN